MGNTFNTSLSGLKKILQGLSIVSTPSGLKIAGRITQVSLDSVSWQPLPAVPLANRNAIRIQNVSGNEMKINYVNNVGYVGVVVIDNGESYYDITDAITLYGRLQSGSGSVTVEEIS